MRIFSVLLVCLCAVLHGSSSEIHAILPKPLYEIVQNGSAVEVEEALVQGANVDLANVDGKTSLHFAADYGDIDTVNVLLKYRANVNLKDKNGQTAMHSAALGTNNKYLHVLESLVEAGAQRNGANHRGETPLHIATITGYKRFVELLIMNGANVDQTTKYGFTPLHYASLFEDHDEIMKCLLSWKAGVDIEGNNGWTPLFLAAIKGWRSNADVLIKYGANVNHTDSLQLTPLHWAVDNSKQPVDILEILLQNRANVDATNEDGMTPMYFAIEKDHLNGAKILLNYNANLGLQNKYGATLWDTAIEKDRPSFIKLFIESGANVNSINNERQTPLFAAAISDSLYMTNLLIEAGANVNYTDIDGQTALHTAVKYGHEKIAEILLANGAYVNALDSRSVLPLHFAVWKERIDMVELLLNFRANPKLKGDFGRSPWDIASANGHHEIITLFIKYGNGSVCFTRNVPLLCACFLLFHLLFVIYSSTQKDFLETKNYHSENNESHIISNQFVL